MDHQLIIHGVKRGDNFRCDVELTIFMDAVIGVRTKPGVGEKGDINLRGFRDCPESAIMSGYQRGLVQFRPPP